MTSPAAGLQLLAGVNGGPATFPPVSQERLSKAEGNEAHQ